ncbi:MAG: hypothetical protein U1F43_09825 [Myxococcota bacterium]
MKPRLVAASPRVLQEIVDAERVFGRLAAARADAAALLRAFPGAGTARFAGLELDLGRPGAAADLYDQAFAMEPERHVLLRSAIAALPRRRWRGQHGARGRDCSTPSWPCAPTTPGPTPSEAAAAAAR